MTRMKKTVIQGVTREDADVAFASYAKADASINKIQAEIELQCAKIREKHQSELSRLTAERDSAFELLHSYATENQQELFSKKKSLEMAHGTIGFRTGTPKLKTMKGYTWASALELVKAFLPSYVRQTYEIAKDRLLSDRDIDAVCFTDSMLKTEIPMSQAMERCGLRVDQEEAFYVEPKKEETSV